MTKVQDAQLPVTRGAGTSPFVGLIEDAQRRNGWTDEDLERELGLEGANLMTLVRKRVVQLSYCTALKIDNHLDANALELLQVFIRCQATAAEDAVFAMYKHLKVGGDCQRLVDAYEAVVEGDNRVSSLKLPHATVWVVPDATMKPENEDKD